MVISASSLPQVVPDPDPPPKGEYWHGAAGAASGCEERWHPGKAALSPAVRELVGQSDLRALGRLRGQC